LAASAVRRSGHRPYPEDDQQAPTVEKSRAATIFAAFPAIFAALRFSGTLIGPSEEAGMIALTLVRMIERHSNELAAELVTKLGTSPRTTDLRKVPVEELQRQIEEILQHLSEWLLTKTGHDIEQRFFELGERRASQGVMLSDSAGQSLWLRDICGNFWSGRASGAARLKFMARWNCCACWISFSIALYALRPRAMSSTASCRIDRALDA
jgi:hypothetical protein